MNSILELHGAPTGNCIRAAIALEEAGLAYTVRLVDLSKGQHQGADHLSLNSAGKVPVLVERKGDESLFVLTQSNAIIFYAAEKAPERLLPTAAGPRATVYERFFFFLTDVIAPSQSAFFLRGQGLSDGSALLVKRMLSTIEMAEQFVSADAYMGGSCFSIADIAAYSIMSSVETDISWDRLPNLRRWYERVAVRPAVVRGFQAFSLR
ncbi:glutathione S-transferase family protein [Pseudomonas sp. BN417]|uniref:glutathione S-transferase family protein n=1 Tax=Pseudomonas sp. BN417 TaxID=2567890 RepID=UPI002453FD31|nr:glutathione S-transferase family protein [Pseudomonas sp. BN417]MDH4553706.1 glutathione S-transferase family protein [Pseudomonas sp. BN417]